MADDSLFILEVNGQDRITLPKVITTSGATIGTGYHYDRGGHDPADGLMYRSEPLVFPNHEILPFDLYVHKYWFSDPPTSPQHTLWITLTASVPTSPTVWTGGKAPLIPRHNSGSSFGYSFGVGSLGGTWPSSFNLHDWLLGEPLIHRLQNGTVESTFSSTDYQVIPHYDIALKHKTITIT